MKWEKQPIVNVTTSGGGSTGSVWYSGVGVPSATLGTTLDYYLNTVTGDVYSKSTGQWIKKMTLSSGSDGVVVAASAYNTMADLKADTELKPGMRVKTRGYYEADDDGGAEYIIVEKTELVWAEALANGLSALIIEKERVTYRMFGAHLDGVQDDGPMVLNCHKYADSIFTYDQTGLIKVYTCRVENHSGIIYKQGISAINCQSDVDLSGSTLLIDDTNATWYGIYVWGDVNSLYYDWEVYEDVKEYFKADNFVFPMHTGRGEALPANTVIKIEEDPYSARDDAGYLYTVARRELIPHDMNGICSSPLTDDWDHAGGEEINCKISNLSQGTTETMQAFSTLKASYTYIPAKHGTFTGCDVLLNMSASKYCTVMWCKRHNATVQNFIFRPRVDALHNTAFKNTMIYLWDSYNVTVRNLQGFNASGQMSGSTNGSSGYMFRATNCSDITLEDCRMQGYWGATAMDSVKNVRVRRCHLNRLDTHDYFANLWVDECTFYNSSIQIGYGRGLCSVNNSKFFWNPINDLSYPSSHIIEFNCTYGRIFEGKIHVENCQVVTKNPPDNEFNIFKMEFSPNATSITKHFQFPQITVKNVDIQSNESNTHYGYFKVIGSRRATTSDTSPTHVYDMSNDGSVTWKYIGRGVDWGGDVTSIQVGSILRVTDKYIDENKKTRFYNIRFYRCTQAGTLSFSGDKPTITSSTEFTCGSAKLVYAPDVLWKSKWSYAVGDICALSKSNWYPLILFQCVTAGVSNGYFPTHTSGTVLEGTNDPVSEPDCCWWKYVAKTSDWCSDWQANMTVTVGQRIVVTDKMVSVNRIYEIVRAGELPALPPYDTYWFGEHDWGTARLKFIGAVHQPQTWFMKGSYCVARDNVYQLEVHDGTTSGVLPTRGNPYCVDGDIIWKYVSGDNVPINPTDPTNPTNPVVPTEGVEWQANTEYADGTFIQSGTRIYEVQQATTGASNPTDTSGNVIMDGERRVQFLIRTNKGERQRGTNYDVGHVCYAYAVGTSTINVFAQVIQAGTTAETGWGPVADAAWTSDGTLVDGTVIWKKIGDKGIWRNNGKKYPSGTVYLTDTGVDEGTGYVRLYMSLGGLSGTSAPTDTSGSEFKNGTLILKYVGEATTTATTSTTTFNVSSRAAEGDTWSPNTMYNVGDRVVSNGNTYECVFDGKLVMPSQTVFEHITTNMSNGHVFWFYRNTDIPTKQGVLPWKLIVSNCEGIDPLVAEGITGDTPYFCHSGNPNPEIIVGSGATSGVQGLKGDKGDKGDTGEQGPPGIDGTPGITWKDTWSSSATYNLHDAVSYNGSSYLALSEHNGVTPGTNIAVWALLAQKGADGSGSSGDGGSSGGGGNSGGGGSSGGGSETSIASLVGLLPAHYQRDACWQQGNGRTTIVSPTNLAVNIHGNGYILNAAMELDLNSSASWDSITSDYTIAANRAGKDFYIYACIPLSGTVPLCIFSADRTAPVGYSVDNSRKIGGFHCLCVDAGVIADHPLSGYMAGDVLPDSVWDLQHRPFCNPEGMVYSEQANLWVDIYLQSGIGTDTASAYNGTARVSRCWMDIVDDFAAVQKRLLDDAEFQIIAEGSNQQTNIKGNSKPNTTGGHVDSQSRRMISHIGCEDCCGVVWQWLRDQAYRFNSPVSHIHVVQSGAEETGVPSEDISPTWSHIWLAGNKGRLYAQGDKCDVKLIAGGNWSSSANSGSRARWLAYDRSMAITDIGARGCASPV